MKISCSDLEYKDYVKIIVRKYNEVSLLKDIPEEEFEKIRSLLITEFQSLIGDTSFSNFQMLKANLEKFYIRINIYETLLSVIKVYGVDDEVIKELFLKVKFTIKENETKDKVYSRLKARLLKAELQYKSTYKELESLQKEATNHKELSEIEMYQLIANISAGLMFSVSINENTVVVAGYIKLLNQQNNKRNGRR